MFNYSEPISGMLRVKNEDLIYSCEETIKRSQEERAAEWDKTIQEELNKMIWWWDNLGRFFFLPRPNEKKAKDNLSWRICMVADLCGSMTESRCKKLMASAKRNPEESMWITVESANSCNFKKKEN